MNDLGNRLHDLAEHATAGVELRNPRFAPRRRPLRTWIAGLVAALLASIAALAGGGLVLNTGDSTEVSTVEGPTSTPTAPPSSTPTTEPGVPDATDGTAPAPPPSTPATSDPGPGDPGDAPSGLSGVSLIALRYGELGPELAERPNDGVAGTAGSGCSPGDAAGLPDGIWMVDLVEFGAGELVVDLVCYRTVESDVASDPGGGLFEDHELESDSSRTRTVPLAPDAGFFLQTAPPVRMVDEPTETRPFGDPSTAAAFAEQAGDPTPLGWVLVDGGRAVEFYSPPLQSA